MEAGRIQAAERALLTMEGHCVPKQAVAGMVKRLIDPFRHGKPWLEAVSHVQSRPRGVVGNHSPPQAKGRSTQGEGVPDRVTHCATR